MATVASISTISLSGLFGASSRYYEFTAPLELTIELDDEGLWHHRLPHFKLWTFEPDRLASLHGLQAFLDTNYETFALAADETLSPSSREYKQLMLQAIKQGY